MRLAKAGCRDAFAELYDRHEPSVRRLLLARSGDPDLSADLTNETFAHALLGIGTYHGGPVSGWLAAIADQLHEEHVSRHRERREVPVGHFSDDLVNPVEGPEREVIERAIARLVLPRLQVALDGLIESHRTCLVLRFVQDKTMAETARLLGLTEAATRSLQNRAIDAVRRRFDERRYPQRGA